MIYSPMGSKNFYEFIAILILLLCCAECHQFRTENVSNVINGGQKGSFQNVSQFLDADVEAFNEPAETSMQFSKFFSLIFVVL